MAAPLVGAGIIPTGNASCFTEAVIDFSNTGDNAVVSGSANQTIRVFRLFFVSSDATIITLKNGSTALTGAMTLSAGGAFVLDYQCEPWFRTTAGNGFIISQTGTAQISGRIYHQKS